MRAWLLEDPDPDTRAELEALLAAHDTAAIADRFGGRLEFGTAGLRGALGAGPNRMNRVVVIRAAAGLATYLSSRGGRGVVIGYDARHKSDVFARDTAEVMRGAGLEACVLPAPAADPGARVRDPSSRRRCRRDGHRVAQPATGQRLQGLPRRRRRRSCRRPTPRSPPRSRRSGRSRRCRAPTDGRRWATTCSTPTSPGSAGCSIPARRATCASPTHRCTAWAATSCSPRSTGPASRAPDVVAEQGDPDPDFHTVSFPNPEEPGAIDLALAAARDTDADLVLANDPDADRCAVAVTDDVAGGWRMLRGDELGALLAMHLVRRAAAAGSPLTGVFAASIVSSSLLGRIAAAHGLGYAETLTGFKWISRVEGLRYGYEEAIGYCVDPDSVRDKDGVSAALLVAELAATLKAEGRTLLDLLDDIARDHGLHATDQLSARFDDLEQIEAAMARLRDQPPTALGGRAVTSIEDLAKGDGGLPPTDGLRYRLEGDGRVIVRPSGTEPKVKCYVEVVEPVIDGDVATARRTASGPSPRSRPTSPPPPASHRDLTSGDHEGSDGSARILMITGAGRRQSRG